MTSSAQPPYVSSDAGTLTGALLLQPAATIDQLAPIKGEPSPIAERALAQHAILAGTLRDRGVTVTLAGPALGTPAESIVADSVVMLPQGAVIARPAALERRAETKAVEAALVALGVPVIGRIEAPGLLDALDVAFGGDAVYIGVPRAGGGIRPHSNEIGRRQLEAIASASGIRTVELALAPEALRLRNVFNFVARDVAIVAPERVDVVPLANLTLIEVPRGEEFAAGVLALGERRVLANLRFRESIALLRSYKIAVDAIDVWEFGKIGAGPHSLVLPVKRS